MREKLKYFILNNAYDFNRGLFENMAVEEDRLRFRSDRISGIGRFMTRVFDAGERGTEWHRLLIHTENCSANELRSTVYAADRLDFTYNGASLTVEDVLRDKNTDLAKKREILAVFEKKRVDGAKDALLHGVKGRYLWIYTEVFGISDKPAEIRDIRVFLPATSWIDYLPQIYRESDKESGFLERYLGVFQTLYEEMEDEIGRIADRFDPESAATDFLRWLAEWLDISDSYIWEEEKFRKLLLTAVSLYRSRGTKESVERAIELYTGEKPFIVENHQLRAYAGTPAYEKTLLPMYGNDPYKVFVLIKSEAIKSNNDIDVLWRITREMMPVMVDFELKVLEPYVFLDQYSYLGANSYLGRPGNASLDGKSRLPFSMLGE